MLRFASYADYAADTMLYRLLSTLRGDAAADIELNSFDSFSPHQRADADAAYFAFHYSSLSLISAGFQLLHIDDYADATPFVTS